MPLHVAAARALGAEPPEFIHHAVVLGEHGKLSKREGASSIARAPLGWVPPAAVVNQLGLVATSGPGELLTLARARGAVSAPADRPRGGAARPGQAALAVGGLHLGAVARAAGRSGAAVVPGGHSPRDGRGDGPRPARRPHPGRGRATWSQACWSRPSPCRCRRSRRLRSRYPDHSRRGRARAMVDELRAARFLCDRRGSRSPAGRAGRSSGRCWSRCRATRRSDARVGRGRDRV